MYIICRCVAASVGSSSFTSSQTLLSVILWWGVSKQKGPCGTLSRRDVPRDRDKNYMGYDPFSNDNIYSVAPNRSDLSLIPHSAFETRVLGLDEKYQVHLGVASLIAAYFPINPVFTPNDCGV